MTMDKNKIITIINKTYLDAEFSPEDFDNLFNASSETVYQPSDYITQENSLQKDMFFLLEGSVDVYKIEKNKEVLINTLSKGNCFGEISFFSKKPRTATVRANSPVKTLVIKEDLLKQYPNTYRKLELAAYRMNYNLVLNSNRRIAESIRKRMDFARIFTTAIIVLMISNFFVRMLSDLLKGLNVHSTAFTWIYLLIIAIPCVLIIRINKENLSTFGLTFNNWKQAITEGALLSSIVILIFLSFIYYNASLTHQPWTNYLLQSRLHIVPFSNYVIHASVQEFLRSIFYVSLVELYGGKKILANFFGALVFATLHIHFGYIAVLVTFIAGFLFNLLQERHKTLLGIILFHSLAGWAVFTVKLI